MARELDRYTLIERSITKKYRKEIWNPFIKAIKDYELIKSGDNIAVCISGGKDSMLMALLFKILHKRSEVPFNLKYIAMNPGYNEKNLLKIKENAEILGIDLEIFDSEIFSITEKISESPCYLCARMRRGYLYSEAKKYSSFGTTLIQPLYYKYPETYDEPLYKNEYYFGSELFVAPITTAKDSIMNRVVHRLFLPNGVWYDFKTGKKYIGGRRYVTFYKDEDYPVFAITGAIIPMAVLDLNNINDTSSPKKLEIHIFPGRSNSYKLYEDDGYTLKYKQGYSFTTEIKYFYKENDFSVSLEPLEGKAGVIPEKRDYKIRFRNTKYTDGVQVFCDQINVPFRRYVEENDFIIEFDNMPVSSKIFVYCKGQDIEIDASRVINDDLVGIISDLTISTELKEKIDEIMFSNESINAKRIAIRKLRFKGLPSLFIKMFMKLFEYLAEI